MESQPPSYRREFLKSPHHAWFGLATLGLGFLSAEPLFLMAGLTAYSIGWIYLPDLSFFKKWVDQRRDAANEEATAAQIQEFNKRRESHLAALSYERRDKYAELAKVCRDIEKFSAD